MTRARDIDADARGRVDAPRRDFLRLSLLAPLAALASPTLAAAPHGGHAAGRAPDGRPHRFELSRREFLLDGDPFVIRSGGMHPIRIPRAYWRHRVRMARAMGLNTIALYVMWNALEAEPGQFDLTTGRRDFARFIRICQEEGLWVYLRPGPYVCGEWDFGGLPPYLLRHPGIRVRDGHDATYMAAVRRYVAAVAPVVKPLLAASGGPVLMLQIENEYASFGHDLGYLEALRALWQQQGIAGPFAIADGLSQVRAAHTYLPGAALGLDGDTDFAGAQALAGEQPVWMSEGYTGWLTHWGDAKFAGNDFVPTLRRLLAEDRSFNLYVAHGGTNFGFGAGANAKDDDSDFQPVITSYDYGAPIDERGVARSDYFRFRGLLAAHVRQRLPAPPAPPPLLEFAPLEPRPFAALWDNLPAGRQVARPQANELLLHQDHGLVLYRRRVAHGGRLEVEGVRDYALVFLGGRFVGAISRVRHASLPGASTLELPPIAGPAELEILVDSFGHVGYGHAMADRKGLTGAVRLDGDALLGWEVVGLPLDDAWLGALKPLARPVQRAGVFFRAELALERVGDCYLDLAAWDRGYVWVNGHLLGRYWRIGPQQRLFCPGPWWRSGTNAVLLLDLHRTQPAAIGCAATLA
ncbi:MAG TPA: beta-galactosidase [Rhodanobacteraceae bacterium]|nr:beta-galactosidase [Rhodanobacteraceae bacterium]